jgi:hypothetical protein
MNRYVNLSPQQRMAQMLQQQQQMQPQQAQQVPQAQNPMQDIPAMMQMHMRNKQLQSAAPQAPQGYIPSTGMMYGD